MKDEELINALKMEMLLAEARARGAKEAYQREAIEQARRVLAEKRGINPCDRIEVVFAGGVVCIYEYREIAWGQYKEEPTLRGRKILKSGKPSKNNWNEEICGISNLHYIKKNVVASGECCGASTKKEA